MGKKTNYFDKKTKALKLRELIESFKPSKILVVGDAILDIYHSGIVERISREAPIPILKIEKQSSSLGGAAATAKNLQHLGCQVSLCCLVGRDDERIVLSQLMEENNINKDLVIELSDFKTLVKQRFLAKNQQIFRADYEKNFNMTKKEALKIAQLLSRQIENFDALIISDYEKGLLHPVILKQLISSAKKFKIPCVCDPGSGANFKLYQGVTTIKPNRSETEKAVKFKINNLKNALEAAKKLKKMTKAEFLSISLDSWGILFFESEDNFELFSSESKEIFDVSGAGDMVTSVLAAFLAIKTPPKKIIPLANQAASIVVSRLGAVSVSLDEIKNSLMSQGQKKIISLEDLIKIRKKHPNASWVMTNGYFDDIHSAKIKFLKDMANLGDISVVAINSDEIIKKQQAGKKYLLDQNQKAELIASMIMVDWVIIFDDEDAAKIIQKIKPNYVVKSSKHKKLDMSEIKAAKQVNAKIKFLKSY